MLENLLFVVVGLLVVTLAVAVAVLVSLRRLMRERVSPDHIARTMRDECDFVRRDTGEHARVARAELAESLNAFQGSIVHSFGVLSQTIDSRVREFGGKLGEGMAGMNGRVDAIAGKLDRDIEKMGTDASRSRDVLRESIEGRLQAAAAAQGEHAKALREEVGASVRTLGSQNAATLADMSLHQKERLEKTEGALRALTEQHVAAQDGLRRTVDVQLNRLRDDNSAKLDEMRRTVDEKLQTTLETRLSESFRTVQEQLVRVHESVGQMQSLTSSVGDLNRILANPKLRGSFGETQLEGLLSQMLAPQQYVKNAQVRPQTAERVEFVIKFPIKGRQDHLLLPIDAKFPRETYERLLHANELGHSDLAATLRKQLESEIRGFARDISRKYIAPPVTTEWAILFLPTEGLHLEALHMPGLTERLQREFRIVVAGPTTLAAHLNSLQMYACALDVERKSGEVYKLLGAVKKQFVLHNDVVGSLAKQLNTAAGSVEKLGHRTNAMAKALDRVHEIADETAAARLLGLDDDGLAPDGPTAIKVVPTLLISDNAA